MSKKDARIIKNGKVNGKQQYAIKRHGITIKKSYYLDKLKAWFFEHYPNEPLL